MSKSDLVDIECRVVSDDPRKKAIAVVNGTDERVHGGGKQEKWFWLPRQYVEINDDGTVTIPEWLALEKGLI